MGFFGIRLAVVAAEELLLNNLDATIERNAGQLAELLRGSLGARDAPRLGLSGSV